MKILYIAPLPPPITGHSVVSKALYDELASHHEVAVVNLSKNSFAEGIDSFGRVLEVLNLLKQAWLKQKGAGAVYLTISESLAGNLKDLLLYLLCFGKASRMYIHLHGGSIRRLLWDQHPFLFRLNRFFIKRLGGVLVSGESHLGIFSFVDCSRIHIVPNFAPECLFVSHDRVREKFLQATPLRVLYLSNFIDKKGYNELLDAYLALDNEARSRVTVDFAGKFELESQEKAFLAKIERQEGVRYHGLVDNEAKTHLFSEAHVFCLPTSFLEGQPVSILEAYAAGCVVLTTGQSGILDVFADRVNGYQIERSPDSIRSTFEAILADPSELLPIALNNATVAGARYRVSVYKSHVRSIIELSKPHIATPASRPADAGARGDS